MRKVSDILKKKGQNTISVLPGTSVIDALRQMNEKNIGSIVVMENAQYLGIITERDYSRKVILKGRSSSDTTVADIMTTDLPRLLPTDSIDYCMHLMIEKHIRYLPVFELEKLSGLISMSDVVHAIIDNQKETISHLENYINSGI